MADNEALSRFREQILQEYPRLGPDDKFRFACHPGVSCFNRCCHDVNIFLTPYDLLRLKDRLHMSSEEFIAEHTIIPLAKEMKLPVVQLKMKEGADLACPFLTAQGCGVYEDRPWACRMYPLGLASPGGDPSAPEEEFYFLLQEEHCAGHAEAKEWTIREWIEDQGIGPYDEMGERFKQISMHGFLQKPEPLDPRRIEMFFTACYDVDKFRRFVFDSSFLERFDLDEQTIEEIRNDDVELLKFGFRWVRYCVFGEPTLQMRKADKASGTG